MYTSNLKSQRIKIKCAAVRNGNQVKLTNKVEDDQQQLKYKMMLIKNYEENKKLVLMGMYWKLKCCSDMVVFTTWFPHIWLTTDRAYQHVSLCHVLVCRLPCVIIKIKRACSIIDHHYFMRIRIWEGTARIFSTI